MTPTTAEAALYKAERDEARAQVTSLEEEASADRRLISGQAVDLAQACSERNDAEAKLAHIRSDAASYQEGHYSPPGGESEPAHFLGEMHHPPGSNPGRCKLCFDVPELWRMSLAKRR